MAGFGLLDFAAIAALRDGEPADVAASCDDDALALLITTSGSTARPKGVMFSQKAMISSNSWQAIADPMPGAYRRFVIAPMSTSAGTFSLLHTLLCGGTAYLEGGFDADYGVALIARERISFIACSPIFFQRMADSPVFADADLSSVHIAHTGGAAVPEALLRIWAGKGVMLRQLYGQTECGGTGVVNSRAFAMTKPESCGGSSMFTDVAIVDRTGRPVPRGELGEIALRGPGFMLGYWNNPEATQKALVDGWLRTGDIGVLDEMGHLRMVDRLKDIIISGGLNISAAEIERVLTDMAGVDEVAVIAARDDRFGEVPMAVIHGPAAPPTAAIIDHCNIHLSAYKVPRYLVRSDDPLPRLASGKISKPELRGRYGGANPLPDRVR
jgi:acyl-CoA synthetase (AMP-forming)/AMP-acid ligase II